MRQEFWVFHVLAYIPFALVKTKLVLVINGDTQMTNAVNVAQSGSNNVSFRNRIINGAMVIDQRNAGASVTPSNQAYTLDRWTAYQNQASKYSVQQNAGSVTPPAGFSNYLGVTSLSAYSVLTGDYNALIQAIEGFNGADLAFGTASASTITISFWVRSSLTGTFGAAIKNNAGDRSYPFTYTISAANTWEQKSVTIPGDTSGTWLTNNSRWAYVQFGLGVGATYSAAAGAWTTTNCISATGATSVVGTNGATFYITGVQLEAGSTASPFEYRSYGTELALCQRYFYNLVAAAGSAASTTKVELFYQHPVPMRAAPTLNVVGLIRVEDVAVGSYSQSSATSTLEQANYLSMKTGFGNLSGLTVARPYFIATLAASITASPPTNLCQVSAEL
jgi:hypothetical protein